MVTGEKLKEGKEFTKVNYFIADTNDVVIAAKLNSLTTKLNSSNWHQTKEISEVMSQLWRVLNTEIAAKRQSASKAGAHSLSDTTRVVSASATRTMA